jgi:hypothetical protein
MAFFALVINKKGKKGFFKFVLCTFVVLLATKVTLAKTVGLVRSVNQLRSLDDLIEFHNCVVLFDQ